MQADHYASLTEVNAYEVPVIYKVRDHLFNIKHP